MIGPRLDAFARRLWTRDLGVGGTLLDGMLAPVEALFGLGVGARNRAYDRRLARVERVDVPVVSVGNLAVGGSGKTPFAHWVADRLSARGERPAVLHGGYAADEPELHRRWAPAIPVFTDGDRARGARAAQQGGATVIVLDDAFQHRRLHRDLDIVLVAAEHWTGEPRLLPRGPWRERPTALARAGLVVCTRKTASAAAAADVARQLSKYTDAEVAVVHLRADTWMHGDATAEPPDGRTLIVAALASPTVFEADAKAAGADVADTMYFADHHEYTRADADAIMQRAAGRAIVTTEKDWTKLDRLLDARAVWLLRQTVVPGQGAGEIDAALDRLLS